MIDQLLASKKASKLSQAEISQPCCTALQVALVDLLARCGVTPAAVVGHSSGEIAAAYACGAITSNEAILIAYYRGKAMLQLDPAKVSGGMAAVGLGADSVTPFLEPGVVVGCENSPNSTTITGDAEVLQRVMKAIKDAHPETLVRALQVDRAYHSRKWRGKGKRKKKEK